jgi:hypothetical protein
MGVPYSHISPEEGEKNKSLNHLREVYKKDEVTEEVPYADTIYKMIDDVIEHQLDKMADMDLENFYRAHMQLHYEDKRNAIAFNDAWMAMKESRNV